MDENFIKLCLEKCGLKVEAQTRIFERKEMHNENSAFSLSTISRKKKSGKRKRENRGEVSTKSRQKYSTKERLRDSCRSHKYFSNSATLRLNFNVEKAKYLEHEKSSKHNSQKKKTKLKVISSILKTLEGKRRNEGKRTRGNDKFSQTKVENVTETLKKLPLIQNEMVASNAFAYFSGQDHENSDKTLPNNSTFKNNSNGSNDNMACVDKGIQLRRINEECSEVRQGIPKPVGKVPPLEKDWRKNNELYDVDGRHESRVCDANQNSTSKNDTRMNLILEEDEYDSRGEDSEDDKQTVIFEEKSSTMKQQNVKTNVKRRKLKSPRTLKRKKPSLVRIIKNKKRVGMKKLGKPTRKLGRKACEKRVLERNEETTIKDKNLAEKCGDVLVEVSNLIKQLHDAYRIILHLKKNMEENAALSEHFKTVIESQQENYRKDIWRNQETIMKGYDKMMSLCKQPGDVILEISKRTSLSTEDVENVISRCILVENALEMLKSTNKLSSVGKNLSKEMGVQVVNTSSEKDRSTESVGDSVNGSEIIRKKPHSQRIILEECQNQFLQTEVHKRLNNLSNENNTSNRVNSNGSYTLLSKHLPCPSYSTRFFTSTQRQVEPSIVCTDGHSGEPVLPQSHDPNYVFSPCQRSQNSQINFINEQLVKHQHQNSFPMTSCSSENQRYNFVQRDQPREQNTQTLQSENNTEKRFHISQMRRCMQQRQKQQQCNSKNFPPTCYPEQQISSAKRVSQPQNLWMRFPIPCMSQPAREDHDNREPVLMHRPSVQGPLHMESNFTFPFSSVTHNSYSLIQPSCTSHIMISNSNTIASHHPTEQASISISRSIPPINSLSAQKIIPSYHIPRSNSRIPSVSNMCSVSSSTPVRAQTSTVPLLSSLLQKSPFLSQTANTWRFTGEAESDLNRSNPVHPPMNNIPPPVRTLPVVTRSSEPLTPVVSEQPNVTNANEEDVLKENRSSVHCSPWTLPATPSVQSSKTEEEILDPTVPQKLTMRNQRLQAGTILMSSAVINESQFKENDVKINPISIVVKRDHCEQGGEVEARATRNSTRKYECAEKGCKNSGIRICKGCKSVIYCSNTCQLNHWRMKHKEECAKLRELRG